ncbi:MAG: prenyltransferase/squalene oxidase repeat-containing protein [Bacteroidia bacterium]|nr:prenyltransferase/squalene oxidase repeat-containing protein [Bacteroidia bacterium]
MSIWTALRRKSGSRLRGRLPALLLGTLLAGCMPRQEDPQTLLREACAWLWAQQAEDGGWHSQTHGILRGGQALTPFVLYALMQADDLHAPPPGRPEAGLAFLRSRISPEGVLGTAQPRVLEYPNYATSYALRVLLLAGDPQDSARIRQMAAYLKGQQMQAQRGIAPASPAFGGWGFGETNLQPGMSGHVDLSHTRKALQALAAAGALDSAARADAALFLRRCQLAGAQPGCVDGGFIFSPAVPGVNKGGFRSDCGDTLLFRTYATASCEGLLALRAAGFDSESPEIQAVQNWLARHPDWGRPGGIDPDDPAQWHRTLWIYYLWVRSEACGSADPGWPQAMLEQLLRFRQPDGSFFNPEGARNKENDPLIATSMAVQMLARSLQP